MHHSVANWFSSPLFLSTGLSPGMSPGMCETRCREVQHQYPEMMRELEAAGGEETWCFGCGHSAPYATYFEDWKHAWKEWSLLGWAPLCTWFGLFITKVACVYVWKIFGEGNLYSRKLFLLCTYYQDSAGLLNLWLTLLEEFHFELLIGVSTHSSNDNILRGEVYLISFFIPSATTMNIVW